MDPYGNYAIYFLDIFGTFEATLLAYLLGVLTVLTLGLEFGYILDRITRTYREPVLLPEPQKEEVDVKNLQMTTVRGNSIFK